jgi:hypothetical protein
VFACGFVSSVFSRSFLADTTISPFWAGLYYRQKRFWCKSLIRQVQRGNIFCCQQLASPLAAAELIKADGFPNPLALSSTLGGSFQLHRFSRLTQSSAMQYEDAARLKKDLERAQLQTDAELPALLKELKDLYLQKMGIFFKL